MHATIVKRVAGMGALAAGLGLLVGCGPTKHAPKEAPVGFDQIQKVGALYLKYASTRRDRTGPSNLDELKKYAEGLDEKNLTELGLTKGELTALFVSPRDQQPYGIVPKKRSLGGGTVPSGPPTKGGPPAGSAPPSGSSPPDGGSSFNPIGIVYEQVGAGGQRLVALNSGTVVEVDDAGFQSFVPGGKS